MRAPPLRRLSAPNTAPPSFRNAKSCPRLEHHPQNRDDVPRRQSKVVSKNKRPRINIRRKRQKTPNHKVLRNSPQASRGKPSDAEAPPPRGQSASTTCKRGSHDSCRSPVSANFSVPSHPEASSHSASTTGVFTICIGGAPITLRHCAHADSPPRATRQDTAVATELEPYASQTICAKPLRRRKRSALQPPAAAHGSPGKPRAADAQFVGTPGHGNSHSGPQSQACQCVLPCACLFSIAFWFMQGACKPRQVQTKPRSHFTLPQPADIAMSLQRS